MDQKYLSRNWDSCWFLWLWQSSPTPPLLILQKERHRSQKHYTKYTVLPKITNMYKMHISKDQIHGPNTKYTHLENNVYQKRRTGCLL